MIIGLAGYAGSGKNAVADILVQEHSFKQYAFADKLREMAYAINPTFLEESGWPVTLQQLVDGPGWDYAKREVSGVRELLQRLGVWHRDKISKTFWIHQVFMQWDADDYPPAVITDVRFPNEARWVRENDGELWRVTRPGVGPVNDHISEKLNLAADQTVLNNGSLLTLREKVWELMKGEQAA